MNAFETNTIGWDVGGAYVKSAVYSPGAGVTAVAQTPCPLWQGVEQLDDVVRSQVPQSAARHVVTMTAELVDAFDNRAAGVRAIGKRLASILGRERLSFYGGDHGFIASGEIAGHEHQIASANWLATAEFAAGKIPNAVLVDIGSTTTDVVRLANGRVEYDGYSDSERLASDELVYTGVVRTPLMSLATRVPFAGASRGLAAELFATTADVYGLTGEISGATGLHYTADQRGTETADCRRRLARMIGMDADLAGADEWRQLARHFRALQVQRIRAAVQRRSTAGAQTEMSLLGAGVGRFLVPEIAAALDCGYRDFASLLRVPASLVVLAADCAPAVAVAQLWVDAR